MSAETEVADMLIRITGAGMSEILRISGRASLWTTTNLISHIVYGIAKGGTAKQIATNPAGVGAVTIPKERYEDFKQLAKEYKVKYYKVNIDGTYLDIVARAEDVPIINRILESQKITTVSDDVIMAENLSSDDNLFLSREHFQKILEMHESEKMSISQALDRKIDTDFARKESYFLCDYKNPKNYIEVKPEKAEFWGKEYTKSTYSIYKNNEKVSELTDEMKARIPEKNRWSNQKKEMLDKSTIKDGNLIFLPNKKELENYQSLYEIHGHNINKIHDELNNHIKECERKILDGKTLTDEERSQLPDEAKTRLDDISKESKDIASFDLDASLSQDERMSKLRSELEIKFGKGGEFISSPKKEALESEVNKELEPLKKDGKTEEIKKSQAMGIKKYEEVYKASLKSNPELVDKLKAIRNNNEKINEIIKNPR